jgi:predicted DNA-binding transcriptional regulator YafY
VNRTDRLYALVEELRRVRPRARSARWLAEQYEVDIRTIRRDIGALQQAGVPIYAEAGRRGGYVLDRAYTLPPLNITPREAVATAVALTALAGTPFAQAARSALHKLVSVMAPRDLDAARSMAGRICLADPGPQLPEQVAEQVLRAAEEALWNRSVVTMEYDDRNGVTSSRAVEPLGLVSGGEHWYLVGWCRLRRGVREFRLDRVRRLAHTDEVVALPRLPDLAGLTVGDLATSQLRLEADSAQVRDVAGKASNRPVNADRVVPARHATMRTIGVSAHRRDPRVDGQHQPRHRSLTRSPAVGLDAVDRPA